MKIQPLNEKAIKAAGWNDIYISGYSQMVHIFNYSAGPNNKNIIVMHTPVTAAKNCFECFEQLGRIYKFNVFAVDYVPGEGECSGDTKDFTLPNMVANLDAVYEYICANYSDDIHLLGYTGAGGIMAQYYLGTSRKFKSFAQFACGIYGDTAPLGIPKYFAKPVLSFYTSSYNCHFRALQKIHARFLTILSSNRIALHSALVISSEKSSALT